MKLNVNITCYLASGTTAFLYTSLDVNADVEEAEVEEAISELNELISNTMKSKMYLRINTIGVHCDSVQAAQWGITKEEEEV
jgi:hypothetical protein